MKMEATKLRQMGKKGLDSNYRKLLVLQLASASKYIRAELLVAYLAITMNNARQCLDYYRRQGLLRRKKKGSGLYAITDDGINRRKYLEWRLDIIKVTGIDITLYSRNDKKRSVPLVDVVRLYLELGGRLGSEYLAPSGVLSTSTDPSFTMPRR